MTYALPKPRGCPTQGDPRGPPWVAADNKLLCTMCDVHSRGNGGGQREGNQARSVLPTKVSVSLKSP